MARDASQQPHAAYPRNLSKDGHGTNRTPSTHGRNEPLLEEPPGYYAYNEPRAWSLWCLPQLNHKTEDQEGSTRDVASSATYEDPGWMDPTKLITKKTDFVTLWFLLLTWSKYSVLTCKKMYLQQLLWLDTFKAEIFNFFTKFAWSHTPALEISSKSEKSSPTFGHF